MTKYAKINEHGALDYAPRNIPGVSNWSADEAAVLAAGYLPVAEIALPEGKYVSGYQIEAGEIVPVFADIPAPTQEEIEARRKSAYEAQTDALVAEYGRKQIMGILTDERKAEIEAELARISAEIKERWPDAAAEENTEAAVSLLTV